MNSRPILLIIVVAVVALLLGGFVGYRVSEQRATELDRQRLDLVRATRAADLQNRLTMLRVLREQKGSNQDVRNLEISAIVLLSTIDLESLSDSSESRIVLVNVGKALAGYTKDFTGSEFDPLKNKSVAQLLVLGKG